MAKVLKNIRENEIIIIIIYRFLKKHRSFIKEYCFLNLIRRATMRPAVSLSLEMISIFIARRHVKLARHVLW